MQMKFLKICTQGNDFTKATKQIAPKNITTNSKCLIYQRTYNKYRFRPSRRLAFICFKSGIFEKKEGILKFGFIPRLKPFRKKVKSPLFVSSHIITN
jgi:hypothetical protein